MSWTIYYLDRFYEVDIEEEPICPSKLFELGEKVKPIVHKTLNSCHPAPQRLELKNVAALKDGFVWEYKAVLENGFLRAVLIYSDNPVKTLQEFDSLKLGW